MHVFTDGDTELLQETFGRRGILGALEKENTPELLDDVSTETLSGALPEILKISRFSSCSYRYAGDDEYRRLREQSPGYRAAGKSDRGESQTCTVYKKKAEPSETSEDAHILSRNSS